MTHAPYRNNPSQEGPPPTGTASTNEDRMQASSPIGTTRPPFTGGRSAILSNPMLVAADVAGGTTKNRFHTQLHDKGGRASAVNGLHCRLELQAFPRARTPLQPSLGLRLARGAIDTRLRCSFEETALGRGQEVLRPIPTPISPLYHGQLHK